MFQIACAMFPFVVALVQATCLVAPHSPTTTCSYICRGLSYPLLEELFDYSELLQSRCTTFDQLCNQGVLFYGQHVCRCPLLPVQNITLAPIVHDGGGKRLLLICSVTVGSIVFALMGMVGSWKLVTYLRNQQQPGNYEWFPHTA